MLSSLNKSIWLIALSLSLNAYPWGDVGHETVAEIAERFIKEDTIKFVQKILGPEPLSVAATFPDQVRSDERFKGFAPYHFVEIPVGVVYQPGMKKNGHTILHQAPGLLRSADTSPERKRILLNYLIHVAGDVHQPLHVGNGHDMGANLCDVRWIRPENYALERAYRAEPHEDGVPEKETERDLLNLHTVWDENMIDVMKEEHRQKTAKPGEAPQKRWFGYKELSDWIVYEATGTKNPRKIRNGKGLYSRAQLRAWARTPLVDWYSESRQLHPKVYPEREYLEDPAQRTYCKWKNLTTGKIENGGYNAKVPLPVLDEAYTSERTPLIRLQLLKGGLRLARLLDRVARGIDVTVEKDVTLLNSLLLENHE